MSPAATQALVDVPRAGAGSALLTEAELRPVRIAAIQRAPVMIDAEAAVEKTPGTWSRLPRAGRNWLYCRSRLCRCTPSNA